MTSRRQLLAAGAVAAAALAGCSGRAARPTGELVVAGGPTGSTHLRQAQLLAAALERAGAAQTVRTLRTSGSAENLSLLRGGGAHLGLALSDAVVRSVGSAVALARTNAAFLHLVVREDGPVTSLDDLRGRRVSLGPLGSEAAGTGEDLLAGFTADERAGVVHRPRRDAVIAVAAGTLDAVLWWGGLPPAEVASVDRTHRLRAVELASCLPAMQARRPGAYERAELPASAYATGSATPTLGVADLLVCGADLPSSTARTVVDLCRTAAPRLVPQPSDGVVHLEPASLVDTAPVRLHPAAALRYRQVYG